MNDNPKYQSESESDQVSPAFILALKELVESEREEAMMSMPTDRVMRALRKTSTSGWADEDGLAAELLSWFRPVFAAGLFIVLLLAAYNVEASKQNDVALTTTEMVLGLQPVTVAAAYDMTIEDH